MIFAIKQGLSRNVALKQRKKRQRKRLDRPDSALARPARSANRPGWYPDRHEEPRAGPGQGSLGALAHEAAGSPTPPGQPPDYRPAAGPRPAPHVRAWLDDPPLPSRGRRRAAGASRLTATLTATVVYDSNRPWSNRCHIVGDQIRPWSLIVDRERLEANFGTEGRGFESLRARQYWPQFVPSSPASSPICANPPAL